MVTITNTTNATSLVYNLKFRKIFSIEYMFIFLISFYVGFLCYKKIGKKGNIKDYIRSAGFYHIYFYFISELFSLLTFVTGVTLGGNYGAEAFFLTSYIGQVVFSIYAMYKLEKRIKKDCKTDKKYASYVISILVTKFCQHLLNKLFQIDERFLSELLDDLIQNYYEKSKYI